MESTGKYQYIWPVFTEKGSYPAFNNLVVLVFMYYLQGIYVKWGKGFYEIKYLITQNSPSVCLLVLFLTLLKGI